MNAAHSGSVVVQPTLTRSEWLGSTPMASSTGEGSMLSDEHAEPEWTATPDRSRPISTGSASTPWTPRHTRWGSRSPRCSGSDDLHPVDGQRGVDDGRDLPPGRRCLGCDEVLPVGLQRRRRGTEGEERRDRLQSGAAPALLLAAHQEGFEPGPTPHDQSTRSGHPAQLVRAHADQVGVQRAQVDRHVTTCGGGVDVHGDAGVPAEPDHLVDRLEGAHLVIAPLAVHQGGAGQ